MFYKEIDGDYISAEVVNLPNGDVLNEKNKKSVDGWLWMDKPPTKPKLYGIGVLIPNEFLWVFADGKFVIDEFEVFLTKGIVDIGYFNWGLLRNRLDEDKNEFLRRALLPLWEYVKEQVKKNNLVTI